MTREEYNQLSIEEKALLMEYISADEDFELISSLALTKGLKKLAEILAKKEVEHGKTKKSNEE